MIKITYFVHGTTTDNEKELLSGWSNIGLSDLGIKQSMELKNKIDIDKFDIVFCSDLKRAIDSAKLIFLNKKVIFDKRLRECDYGDFTDQSASLIKNDLKDFVNSKFSGGESLKDVEKRIRNFIEFLKNDYQDKHIAIVAHQAPQLAFDVILKNQTWEQAFENDWRKTHSWKPGWEYIIE